MVVRNDTSCVVSGNLLDRRFAPGTVCQVIEASTILYQKPRSRAGRGTEALYGELLTMLSSEDGWCFVRDHLDGYEGWVESMHLSADVLEPTHWVRSPFALTTEERPVQSPQRMLLGMNSRVTVVYDDPQDKFVKLADAGWINRACLRPVGEYEPDFVAVMEQFQNCTPYHWGGRLLKDCSSLVQDALLASGYPHPSRDSGPQSQKLGIPLNGSFKPRRGDVVFWVGHVVVLVDSETVIHATDNVMCVVKEPLRNVAARFLEEEKKPILTIRRFPNYPDLSG